MDGSVDVGAVPRVHVGHRVDHRLRLERGCRTVEVDEWLCVHLLMKRRKVLTYTLYIEQLAPRRRRG